MFTYTLQPLDDDQEPVGDAFAVTADSRDVLRWEKGKPGKRSIAAFLAEPNMTDSYVLAYLAARRLKKIPQDVSPQVFEERYLLVMAQEPAPDPTRPGV